jgi:sugar phosphate isomerase/epimerase
MSEIKRISRREFMVRGTGTAASILAATALSSCNALKAASKDKPGSKMRFGMVTYQWGEDWDLPTLLKNCEAAKVYGVELRSGHAHGVEPSLNEQQRKDVKKRFADSPITLVGLGAKIGFDSPDPEELKKNMEFMKEFIKLSYDVGSSGVRAMPNKKHKEIPIEQTIEQIGKSVNELGRFGADYGQQFRLEVHGDFDDLPTYKKIMDIAANPNVTVCWNSNPRDLKGQGLEYNFNLVKDRFGATAHVGELDSKDYPFAELIKLFVKMDYKGWLLLEASSKPADRVKALAERRMLFEKMVADAQAKV